MGVNSRQFDVLPADYLPVAWRSFSERLGDARFTGAADLGHTMRDEEVVRYTLAAISTATQDPPETHS